MLIPTAIEQGGGFYNAYAYLREEQPNNTDGGTPTTGSFVTRVLNTEVYDPASIVTLSSNEFTLQAGAYHIVGWAPFYQTNRTRIRIRNMTDGTDVIYSPSYYMSTSVSAGVRCDVTISSAKAFALQYRAENAGGGTFGLGLPNNYSINEVYSEVEIWRYS